jgi:hypothetical protein
MHKSIQSVIYDDDVGRREMNMNKYQDTYAPPSPAHPVQLYFYSARRPLPFRRYFSRYPGILCDKNKSMQSG